MAIDTSYNGTNYREQGNTVWDIGGILNIQPGGQIQDNGVSRLSSFTFTPAQGTSNICNVTIAAKDALGNALAGIFELTVWLSDASTGLGLTATTASGTVQAAASGGTDFGDYTAKKAKRVQTTAAGTYVLAITDTAKTGFYVAATNPSGSRPAVSAQLITANYG